MIRKMRVIKALLAGTVALMIWGMFFWGAISPAVGMFKTLPNEHAVTAVLGNLPTGTYFVPWPMDTPETRAAFRARHQAGSFFQLSFVREGVDPQSPATLLRGALHHLVATAIAVLLVLVATPSSRLRAFLIVILAGSLGTVFATLGVPVWFHLPWFHAAGRAVYELVSWIILGLTCASTLVRKKR